MKISSARSVGKWQGVFFWGVPLARHGLCIERTPQADIYWPTSADLNQPGALTGLPAPWVSFWTQNWIQHSRTHCHNLCYHHRTYIEHDHFSLFPRKRNWSFSNFPNGKRGCVSWISTSTGVQPFAENGGLLALSLQPLHDDVLRLSIPVN